MPNALVLPAGTVKAQREQVKSTPDIPVQR